MGQGGQVIPNQLYEEMEALILQRFGDDWANDKKERRRFLTSVTSVIETSTEMHLIEKPEPDEGRIDFDLWVEYPVADVWDADELAFSIFSQIADDIFLSSRQVEERGVRYRFITGSMDNGHLGSLHLTGPNAMDFVNLYRMKITQGERYHA